MADGCGWTRQGWFEAIAEKAVEETIAERHQAILQERTREWHEAGPDSPIAWRSLPEHLGMTIAEYNRWVEGRSPA